MRLSQLVKHVVSFDPVVAVSAQQDMVITHIINGAVVPIAKTLPASTAAVDAIRLVRPITI